MSDPYLPGHGDRSFSVTHYELDLGYRPQGNRLTGQATLSCTARADLNHVVLDLAGNLDVAKVSVAAAPARHTHRGNRLRVQTGPRHAGEEFTVVVKYGGAPRPINAPGHGLAGWEELTDGVIVAGQPHGAPSWFPCNDRLDDKATYALELSAPADYHVSFSGTQRSCERSGASRRWRFEQSAPMASYLATVQIGRYRAQPQPGPVPFILAAPEGAADPAFEATFGDTGRMLDFFSDRFGPYPFESYTTVVTEDPLDIPLESQSLSTFGSNFATGDWEAVRLVAHELAHQWFGNSVTLKRWRDIWLHEGFACYAEWLWSQEAGLKSTAERAAHHHARLRALPQDLVLSDPGAEMMFDDRVYKRGALTLHALRMRVGDEVFFDILRSWVRAHTAGSVTTEDFVAHASRVSGQPLADFFRPWLEQRALPPLPAP